MGYVSLYREFRPSTFEDVAGQGHITGTLINQIKAGRIGHAYLFTGSRGIGKTTCARIFAKAINCLEPKNGSPCTTCDVCKKLENASNLDIVEIDAASNNGVEDARELRERVKYPPVNGRYKVFIIDEVHMLSTSAFNALLKILEEPPSHVVFILATTEIYKLPATIISRVMRFDFRLLPTMEISKIVADAYKKRNKEFEPEAVNYIAMLGEGSVRDALSIADRCLNVSEGKLRYQDILQLLGAASMPQLKKLITFFNDGDIGESLQAIDNLIKGGSSVNMIAKDLISLARDMLVIKTAPSVIELPKAEKDELKSLASGYSVELLTSIIQIFSAVDSELRYAVSPRTVIEAACIRACKLAATDLSSLIERVSRLEKHGIQGVNAKTKEQTAGVNINNSERSDAETKSAHNNIESTNADIGIGNKIELKNTSADISIDNITELQNTNAEISSNNIGKDKKSDAGFDSTGGSGAKNQGQAALPSARSLWGRIITYLRKNATPSVYGIASEIGEVTMDGTTLKIICGRDNFLSVSDAAMVKDLKRAAASMGYDCIEFEAVLVDEKQDMDSELKKLKSLVGNTPLKVLD